MDWREGRTTALDCLTNESLRVKAEPDAMPDATWKSEIDTIICDGKWVSWFQICSHSRVLVAARETHVNSANVPSKNTITHISELQLLVRGLTRTITGEHAWLTDLELLGLATFTPMQNGGFPAGHLCGTSIISRDSWCCNTGRMRRLAGPVVSCVWYVHRSLVWLSSGFDIFMVSLAVTF